MDAQSSSTQTQHVFPQPVAPDVNQSSIKRAAGRPRTKGQTCMKVSGDASTLSDAESGRSRKSKRIASESGANSDGGEDDDIAYALIKRVDTLELKLLAREKTIATLEKALEKKLHAKYDAVIIGLERKISELTDRLANFEKGNATDSIFPPLPIISGKAIDTKNVWQTVASRAVKEPGASRPKLADQQVEMLNSAVAEHDERERRKQNVIVFGLAVTNATDELNQRKDDTEALNKLFSSINIKADSIVSFRRFNSKQSGSSNSPPVLVKLASNVNRIEVLAAAKNLRNVPGYERVYVNQDMTDSERVLEKQLRQRRNELNEEEASKNQPFRWAIRGNTLKRFATSSQRQQLFNVPASASH